MVARRRRRPHRQGAWRTGRGGAEGGEKLEASQPTRPSWVDQTFFRETDRLLFVGHSTLVGDKADGFTEAEAGALEEIVNQIGLSIRDPAWIDQVRSQYEAFRQKAIGDLEKATVSGDAAELERARRAARDGRKRVADSLKKTAGGLAPIGAQRSVLGEAADARRRASTRCRSATRCRRRPSRSSSSRYAVPETAMGAKAVSYFPQLAWRFDVTEGAIVTHVANDSNLRFAGIQEGDLVLAGMDRVVHDARSWKRVLDEESAALTREGGDARPQGQARRRAGHRHAPAHRARRRGLGRLVEQAAPDPRQSLVVHDDAARARTKPATSGTTTRRNRHWLAD